MGIPPQFPPPDPPGAEDPSGQEPGMQDFHDGAAFRDEVFEVLERKRYLRRLSWLMLAGVASFALATWMLVRATGPFGFSRAGSDPLTVVRTELGSLARGDLQSAYAQLSERYRKQVSFDVYNALVASHRRMFLTREYRVTHREEHNGQTLIEAQLTAANGQEFLARFTMIQAAGRWWIDDLHWDAHTSPHLQHA